MNNGISVFIMCLAGFPAARRCHSCVQIKNGKVSKEHSSSIFVIVYAENVFIYKRHNFEKSLFLIV